MLDIKGNVITADAMSCQKTITTKITGKRADFVLRSKDNQRNLKRDVEEFFEEVLNSPQKDSSILHTHTVDKDHGSAVTRDYYSATNLEWMICKDGRTSLNSVGTAISAVICEEITMRECRYFVSSLTDGNVSAKATRSHWGD